MEQNSLAQSSACRLWRGRLLCSVAARMNPNKYIKIKIRIDSLILENIIGLCDDTDLEIRKNMCLNLSATALSLGQLCVYED